MTELYCQRRGYASTRAWLLFLVLATESLLLPCIDAVLQVSAALLGCQWAFQALCSILC
jgi:hypothetical protein